MHKNLLWQALLLLIGGITVIYSSIAGFRYYEYKHLTATATPLVLTWQVEKISDEKYGIQAFYTISVGQHLYSAKIPLEDASYLNSWAAEKGIQERRSQLWKVWYDPNDPSHSALHKKLPIKEMVGVAILWVILLYFLVLGFYVSKYKS
jgi:DNA phosphorothioation-dependent restriction protein DptG